MPLKESFEWAPPGIESIPKGNLLKLIAKTEATAYHPADPNYPVRKFNVEELKLAARTLIGRPVGRNHEAMPIYGAYVLDSEFSAAGNCVESIAYAPTSWVDKVRKGLIEHCSIEYTWRDEKRNGGVEFEGLVFTRLDLLEGLQPGDQKATVKLYEANGDTKTGALLTEVKAVETAVEKFKREQAEPPPAEPVELTPEEIQLICDHYKITPEQYAAEPEKYPKPEAAPGAPAEQVVEPLTPEEIAAICVHYSITPEEYAAAPEKYPKPETVKVAPDAAKKLGEPFAGYANFDACVAANQDQADPAAYCAEIQAKAEPAAAELKEALLRVTTELQTVKTTQDARLKAAKEFAHLELKTAVEAILPKGGFLKDQRANRLILDIKGVLDEPIQTT